MAEIGANNRTYFLISDILLIAGEYTPEELELARKQVELTSKGDYRDIMVSLLKKLKLLNRLPDASPSQPDRSPDESQAKTDKTPQKADQPSASSKKKTAETKTKAVSKDDPKVKKFKNMLENNDFITSKNDIVKIVETYFNDRITLRSDNKDSKRDLLGKTISEYKRMKASEKQKVYAAIRRLYLKKLKTKESNG